jgi:signal transduction histidine kinase
MGRIMARGTIWLLPALLAGAQFLLWPGLSLARGDTVAPARAAAVIALTVVVAVALSRRRRTPVVVTAVVAAAVTLGTWVMPGQLYLVPGDAVLVLALSDMIALFSVAVHTSRRTTALVLVAVLVWQAALTAVTTDTPGDYPLDMVLNVCVYGFVAATGRIRGRSVAEREASARRLAEAEQGHREAADAERRRLARELHDVTAHHLTSIVVNASAAQFLGEQRPELRTEALEFAARTGRETLVALRRLVAILPSGDDRPDAPPPGLADLADDFRQLGQVVTVEVTGDPPARVAAAAHAIAREAMTNTLRYAPGGSVTLLLTYGGDGAHLLIEDDGGAGGTAAAGLGGGRGLAGMRERAAALGGTVEAGPRPAGGWRVRAVFPPLAAGRPVPRSPRSHLVVDGGLALLTVLLPVAGVTDLFDEGASPAALTLILLAVLAHAAPLLWRRTRPWATLGAVAATTWFGPVLLATAVTPDGGWPFLFAFAADMAAVHAVATRGARPGLTWLAPVVALTNAALALATILVLEPPAGPEARGPATYLVLFAFGFVLTALVLAVPLGGSWLAGHLARRWRQRRLDREEGAVSQAVWHAGWRTLDERARIAAGLREAVLDHAARVPRAAEEADLPGVLDAARAALTAMRGLLDGLGGRDREEAPSSVSG